jgi:hypothetical protein
MADVNERALPVGDPEYIRMRGGFQNDPTLPKYKVPEWLKDSLIKVDFIEEFL